MRKSFMTFWKDYAEVTKSSWIWLKKHWFGYIVLVLVVVGGGLFGSSEIRLRTALGADLLKV